MDNSREIQKQILRITLLRAKLALHRASKRKRDGIWERINIQLQSKIAKAVEELERLRGEN